MFTFLFTFLQPATFALLSTVKEQPMKAATKKHRPKASPQPPRQMDNIFIDALVRACSCRQHTRSSLAQTSMPNPGHIYHKARRRQNYDAGRQVRHLHRAVLPPRPPTMRTPLSRDEYISMLDYYREPYSTKATMEANLPSPLPATIFAPRFEHTRPHLLERPPVRVGEPPTPRLEARDLNELSKDPSVIGDFVKILEDSDCTHEEAFEAYSALPFPGVAHISEHIRRLLFRRISVMEKKCKDSMLRYLSVVDDMKAANLPMTQAEWNSAIAFCGQCFARIKDEDLESAFRTWIEMRDEANVQHGNVTFNILFDIAAKAGRFALAEKILQEMEAKELSINRYARVGIIYYHGLKGDGEGVRRAYRELVEAGEIVDTVVLNCVIASLIKAGEPAAAEQVYERMKRMLSKHTGRPIPSLNWREVRDLGRVLDRAARQFKSHPARLQQLQDEQFLAPNLHTYAIFVEHHVSTTGEFRRIAALLTEMQHLGVPMHGRIFIKLFKGFAYHGGIRYSSWTKARLESVWTSLLDVLDQRLNDVRIRKWMVIWIVRAFECCAGRERTLEVWTELRKMWEPGSGEVEAVMGTLKDILKVELDEYR